PKVSRWQSVALTFVAAYRAAESAAFFEKLAAAPPRNLRGMGCRTHPATGATAPRSAQPVALRYALLQKTPPKQMYRKPQKRAGLIAATPLMQKSSVFYMGRSVIYRLPYPRVSASDPLACARYPRLTSRGRRRYRYRIG